MKRFQRDAARDEDDRLMHREGRVRDGTSETESELKNLNLVKSGQSWADIVDKKATDAKERVETFPPEYREPGCAGTE